MRTDRIDFISSYCDRWCERCAFTMRCSAFAVEVATAMCDGDFAAGVELAVGPPPSIGPIARSGRDRRRAGEDVGPTEAEAMEAARLEQEQERRLRESPILTVALGLSHLIQGWLRANRARVLAVGPPAVADSLEIAGWDHHFIAVKLHRALRARERSAGAWDDDGVQNDWNGSAKVALISIERSAEAWQHIGAVSGDRAALHFGGELLALRDDVDRTFPDARRFVRPGFDTES
jgi:hypothetical protein